jgi:hypothetical protein
MTLAQTCSSYLVQVAAACWKGVACDVFFILSTFQMFVSDVVHLQVRLFVSITFSPWIASEMLLPEEVAMNLLFTIV